MVIFWNFAGVPFVRCLLISYSPVTYVHFETYVYSVVYMASHDPSKYRFSTPTYILLFTTLLTAYYMLVYSPISCDVPLMRHGFTHQLGHINVTEESVQDADSGHPHLPQHVPSAALGHNQEPYLHSNGSRVSYDCCWG
jgi:hypothetical protein